MQVILKCFKHNFTAYYVLNLYEYYIRSKPTWVMHSLSLGHYQGFHKSYRSLLPINFL